MFCTNCGNQMLDGSKFCTKCGAPMGALAPEVPAEGASAGGADAGDAPAMAARPRERLLLPALRRPLPRRSAPVLLSA